MVGEYHFKTATYSCDFSVNTSYNSRIGNFLGEVWQKSVTEGDFVTNTVTKLAEIKEIQP